MISVLTQKNVSPFAFVIDVRFARAQHRGQQKTRVGGLWSALRLTSARLHQVAQDATTINRLPTDVRLKMASGCVRSAEREWMTIRCNLPSTNSFESRH